MIELVKMTEDAFHAWQTLEAENCAVEQVRVGTWPKEDAVAKAHETFDQYLPHGIDTSEHRVMMIVDSDRSEAVGTIWYAALGEAGAWRGGLLSLRVYPEHLRKGYASAACRLMEADLAAQGASVIRLHVFGCNAAARALYEHLGYEETDVVMRKRLHDTTAADTLRKA